MDTKDTNISGMRSAAARSGTFSWVSPSAARAPSKPVAVSFYGNIPDSSLFPVDDFLAATQRVMRNDWADALQYGNLTCGNEGLRDLLAELSRHEDGSQVDRDEVMLTSGGAQAISLAIAAFLSPGDAAIVEAPTWGYVLRDIQLAGAKAVAVSIDAEGIVMEELEQKLRELRESGTRAKLVYSIANFNNPTGVCMSLRRRKRLVELAHEWGFLILEDDTYGDLRYEGGSIPSLFGLDGSGSVMKLKTFSKVLAPALRLGWILGHPDAIASLVSVRRDLGVSQITSRVIAEYMREGKLMPHITKNNMVYRAKRDKMRAVLAEYCTPYVTWNNPAGGFCLWLELENEIDPAKLKECAADRGIVCRPGEEAFPDQRGRRKLRLSFSSATEGDIERGIDLLAQALAASRA